LINEQASEKKLLELRRYAEGYRPYFIDEIEISKINFFTKEGICLENHAGYFDNVRESMTETESKWIHSLDNPPTLYFQFGYRKRNKPDFTSKDAFYITVKSDTKSFLSKRKLRAELYIPFDGLTWTVIKDYDYHQGDDERHFYDLYGINELGVGLTKFGRRIPYTKRQEIEDRRKENLSSITDPALRFILESYVTKGDAYTNSKRLLEELIRQHTEELRNLQWPSWIDEMLKPIAELMIKEPELEGYTYEIFGPFGMGARTSIHFKKDAVTHILEFEPGDLEDCKLYLVDFNTDTKRWKQGSIGELNGMNNPRFGIPGSIKELVRWAIH
jgi:hypothetical protein